MIRPREIAAMAAALLACQIGWPERPREVADAWAAQLAHATFDEIPLPRIETGQHGDGRDRRWRAARDAVD